MGTCAYWEREGREVRWKGRIRNTKEVDWDARDGPLSACCNADSSVCVTFSYSMSCEGLISIWSPRDFDNLGMRYLKELRLPHKYKRIRNMQLYGQRKSNIKRISMKNPVLRFSRKEPYIFVGRLTGVVVWSDLGGRVLNIIWVVRRCGNWISHICGMTSQPNQEKLGLGKLQCKVDKWSNL